jgi:hypothetical protein
MDRVKIFMSPASSRKTPNRYIDLTVQGLQLAGVEVAAVPYWPQAGAQAVHLHWPEMYFASGQLSRHPLLYGARVAAILSTIRQIKRRGGRLVWTVHNLEPHRRFDPAKARAFERFHAAVLKELDVFVSLTEAGVAEIRRAFPQLSKTPYVVARHPHYRDLVRPGDGAQALRSRWAFPEGTFVIGCLGQIQKYKRTCGW